ncbi:TetR family transcriptional regulator [Actinocorallia herbida]|uniref:TetR family transcriptional regulator n=1 Tax=Actinocorallia herbida TaxID=58109 RepID=A0A3N1CYC2_9ACTN|nr:TetR family transcriptional regulator [Actinocorallia herbida]
MASTAGPAPTSRAERRRATETRILDEARRLFAEQGYQRATVRAIAAAARVDPSLVIQYFGSKRDLFTRAIQAPPLTSGAVASATVTEELLTTLGVKLGGLPEGTRATLRSMLTDPVAADRARAALTEQITALAATLPRDHDPELRAALITTALVGITIAHQFLDLPVLRDTPTDRIAETLRPALHALTHP